MKKEASLLPYDDKHLVFLHQLTALHQSQATPVGMARRRLKKEISEVEKAKRFHETKKDPEDFEVRVLPVKGIPMNYS